MTLLRAIISHCFIHVTFCDIHAKKRGLPLGKPRHIKHYSIRLTSCPACCKPFFYVVLNFEMALNQWFEMIVYNKNCVGLHIIVYFCDIFVTF